MLDRRGRAVFWIILAIVLVILAIFVVFFSFIFGKGIGVSSNTNQQILQNPASGKSLEEAVGLFDETFVRYLLYSIGANDLHNPPFSKDTPKIEFYIDEEPYNAIVEKGIIIASNGEIEGEDIVIKTTKEEAVKMMLDKEYIKDGFSQEKSSLELVAGKVELASKGYLSIYTELTGESISGSVVRIFS